MGRTRTLLGGLGATAAKPETIESYKLAMKALSPPQPGPRGDEADRDIPSPP